MNVPEFNINDKVIVVGERGYICGVQYDFVDNTYEYHVKLASRIKNCYACHITMDEPASVLTACGRYRIGTKDLSR